MRAVMSMTGIVSGYIIDPNNLEHFIHRLLGDDDPWLAEDNDTSTHYTVLVQWLHTLPKEERVASVQWLALVKMRSSRRTRDRFLDKANAAAGTSVFAAERTRYFSCRKACLGGHVGEYGSRSYPDWVATERKADERAIATAKAEAAFTSPAQNTPAAPTTSTVLCTEIAEIVAIVLSLEFTQFNHIVLLRDDHVSARWQQEPARSCIPVPATSTFPFVQEFVRVLLHDSPWLGRNDYIGALYRILIQWLRQLPKAERTAAVQSFWTTKAGMVVCIITGLAAHHSSRARIIETDKQRKMRDQFIDKVNTTAGTTLFAAERMDYFSLEAECLNGPVGDCYSYCQTQPTDESRPAFNDISAEADANVVMQLFPCSTTTRIVGGYLLPQSDLEKFIKKLLSPPGSSDENSNCATRNISPYVTLLQWMRGLPKDERLAPVQRIMTTKAGRVVCIITGMAEHYSSKARIVEAEKHRKMRDQFIEKANAAIGTTMFTAESMEYFSIEERHLGGRVDA
ncbi:hypothetical protein EVG20_g7430 [Dentipellis fragilis]|uniref:Uncharacterized protein n=1 Tax=Dentipellis fragilis TaxID=205917 RepID=A0A4Y9YDH4_9AGAM|nr:hypothetical protein EVG20_g7430 [Dentipellis fragilis]